MNAPYLGLLVCLIYSYTYLAFFYFPFFFLASFKDMVFAISCINYVYIIVFLTGYMKKIFRSRLIWMFAW